MLSLLASFLILYKYVAMVPYYDSFVSIVWGCVVFNYFWICLNALCMMILDVRGHIVIILLGVPVVSGVVCNVRKVRIKRLLLTSNDKFATPTDCLNRIVVVQQMVKASVHKEDIALIGIVNLHTLECQNDGCPCKNEVELFDVGTKKFSSRDTGYHKDAIFLKHFVKKLYEDGLTRFADSDLLSVMFASYLFRSMKNLHAAVLELNSATKKKPSIQLQFVIHRERNLIENYIKQESEKVAAVYNNLARVVEFEELLNSCQQSIEKVVNYQIEFWSQVTNQLPDLNILHDFNGKIYESTEEARDYWTQLCRINPNYTKALQLYGNYMVEVKNHSQAGYELLER